MGEERIGKIDRREKEKLDEWACAAGLTISQS